MGQAGVTNRPGSNKGEVQAPRGEADLISSLHVLYLILSPPFFYFLLFLLCSFIFFSLPFPTGCLNSSSCFERCVSAGVITPASH